MEEIFAIIASVNKLKDKVNSVETKIDRLLESLPQQKLQDNYVEKEDACKILHVSSRTLDTVISDGSVPFVRVRRRSLFLVKDLYEFLQKNRRH